MALYEYRGVTADNRLMKGSIDASSPEDARLRLMQMGLEVQSVDLAAAPRQSSPVGRNEFLLFNQQLASMAQAGVPLDRGLRELARDIRSPAMRGAVEGIAADLEAGQSVEEAFASRKGAFPPMYEQILRAGIRSGRLGEMLTSLNHHLEVSLQTRRIIVEAMTYPAVVMALALSVFTALLWLVVPLYRELLLDMHLQDGYFFRGRTPSLLLNGLFYVSDRLGAIWIVVLILAAGMFILRSGLRRSRGGRGFLERLLLGVPVLGRLFAVCSLGRLSDAMGLLVGAGCDLPEALRLSGRASGSQLLGEDCDDLARHVEEGKPLVQADYALRLTPRLFLYSVHTGCSRNSLIDNLYSLSHTYGSQARTLQSMLQGVLAPLLLIVVGGMIAVIAVAMIQPLSVLLTGLQSF